MRSKRRISVPSVTFNDHYISSQDLSQQTANRMSSLSRHVTGPHYFRDGCYLIGTLSKPHLQGCELRLQQHFRWVTLRWEQEPLHGLLGRHLHRKLLHKVSRDVDAIRSATGLKALGGWGNKLI